MSTLSTPVSLQGSAAVPTQRAALPLEELAAVLDGALLLPGTPAYDTLATPWNVAVQARPVAVVDVSGADDVAHAVRFAAQHGLKVSVQATGHGATDALEGTLLVHTGRLDQCVVHPEGWARVGAGVKWARVIEAAAPYGLAPLNGSSSDVGVVGYTTGGGLSPMARSFGAAGDKVRAFEVVTGDGVLRRVTPDEHPDLYWGLRGGKGALGIVTAIEFDLLPLATIYGGALYFDGADSAEVLHAWRQWSATLPEQATTSVVMLNLPPMPGVPEPLAGKPTIAVRFIWTGEDADGVAALAPMREVAPMLIDGVATIPYTLIDVVHADPVDPMPVHEDATLLHSFPAEAADALLAVAGPESGSMQVMVEVRQLGGAFARPTAPSAFCHRDSAFSVLTIGVNVPPIAEAVAAQAAGMIEALGRWSTGNALPNFAARSTAEHQARVYPPEVLARLRSISEQYDPAGVLVAARPIRST